MSTGRVSPSKLNFDRIENEPKAYQNMKEKL